MLQLFGHPFSSYTWKVLIALYENATPFAFRTLGPDQPDNGAELAQRWPLAKFPVLVDGDRAIIESSTIIEYLAVHHPGPVGLIPSDPDAAVEARMLDRVFDNHVMGPMQKLVGDRLRPERQRDPFGVDAACASLDLIYAWLDDRLSAQPGASREWVAGDFGLADCAAAPALFYADWAHSIPAGRAALKTYRARLLARPSIARVVDEARPFRALFPLGAPDRD